MSSLDPPAGYAIELARENEIERLAAIERAAAGVIPAADLPAAMRDETLEPVRLVAGIREARLFVARECASGAPVGFALAERLGSRAHLAEIDVAPDHARRGLGRALVAAVASWARERGFPALSLTTFRHLAWNAPFYASLGFRALQAEEVDDALRAVLAREAANGLDPAKRVAMVLDLRS